jgi:hypothetical protein
MLKRIFNRNRKGLFKKLKQKPKKAKVSKYNKLNISTDETNMNTYSFIESGPSIDDEEDELDLPKLNFTCILNNPLEDINNNSIFGQLLSRFQEDQKIVTEEERLKKEGHKFDLIDIIQGEGDLYNNNISYENKILKKIGKKDEEEEEEELDDILNHLEQLENIFGTKKTLEQCIKETKAELFKDKKTFKLMKFVDLNYNNYIAKIKHEYLIYRDNRKKNIMEKINLDDDILNNDNNKIKINNSEDILKQINNYRKSLNVSMDKIEKDYKVDINNFKIKDNLLDLQIENIFGVIQQLIEQKGIIELESEKSQINYDLIKLFFINNYPKIVKQVNSLQNEVKILVNKKNMLKNKFIDISQKMILTKIKKQNMLKLLNIYKSMLYANCDKIETINEILDIRETKEKLKLISDLNIKIIKKINDELTAKELNITNDNITKITTLIKNEINNCFNIETYTNEEEENNNNINDIKNKYDHNYYNFNEKLFKQIIEYKKNIQENLKITDCIILLINSIDEEFIKKKLYTYLELSENKEDYMKKIHDVILSSIEEIILTTLGKILPLKNMNEILYLFYIGKMSQYLLDSINKILEEKEKENIINDIRNKLYDIIDKNLSFIIDDINYSNNLDIDAFIIKNKILKEVYINIPVFSENKNFMEKIDNYEFNYNEIFWKDKNSKIKEILNADNLRCLDNISYEYQKFINVIFSFNYDSLNKDEETKYNNLKNNILLGIDLTIKEEDPKEINLIEITKSIEGNNTIRKCRLISSILDIIKETIKAIKMLIFFKTKYYSKILLYFHDILATFINLSNEIVLETKGQIKNITQNELASSYSSIYLIHEIISQLILFISNSESIEEDVKNKYKELEILASDYMQKNLQKLNNMIKEGIYESSINEYKKIISSEKYPIAKGSLPINPFAENIVKLVKNVNKSLKHCYEDETISKIILDNLNIFIDELEKSTAENKKELNAEEKKQFKRDFTFIRKNIDKDIEDIDFKGFKKKLNAISKKGEDKEK